MNKEKKKKNSCLYLFCKDILVFECLRDFSSFKTNRHENLMYMNRVINRNRYEKKERNSELALCSALKKKKKREKYN